MKRKRLEAWAVKNAGDKDSYRDYFPDSESAVEMAVQWREDGYGPQTVTRLVECGPDEVPMPKTAAAVVRAAVRECASHTETPGFCECDLCRAVERMKGRKR